MVKEMTTGDGVYTDPKNFQPWPNFFFLFQTEADADTMEPKPELSSPALDWCKEMGIKGKTVEDVLNGSDNAR